MRLIVETGSNTDLESLIDINLLIILLNISIKEGETTIVTDVTAKKGVTPKSSGSHFLGVVF